MTAPEGARDGRGSVQAFWARHRKLFWTVHSLWALLTGIVVVVLARERYGFVPWVAFFLVITWISTIVLGRGISKRDLADGPEIPGIGDELGSYVTRTLYQETLFFLLPFYAYSTVVASPNVAFTALLAALALLSCLDLVFDRLLRTQPLLALLFFSVVAFGTINLVLPMVWPMRPAIATNIAAVGAVLGAFPMAVGRTTRARTKWLAALAGTALLATAVLAPVLVPPVPLRMDEAVFSSDLDRETLEPIGVLEGNAGVDGTDAVLFTVLKVFAPSTIPASVALEWTRDGEVIRTSRDIDITAHAYEFRVWDAWRSGSGSVPPGRYTVTIRTANGRIFGRAELTLSEG